MRVGVDLRGHCEAQNRCVIASRRCVIASRVFHLYRLRCSLCGAAIPLSFVRASRVWCGHCEPRQKAERQSREGVANPVKFVPKTVLPFPKDPSTPGSKNLPGQVFSFCFLLLPAFLDGSLLRSPEIIQTTPACRSCIEL